MEKLKNFSLGLILSLVFKAAFFAITIGLLYIFFEGDPRNVPHIGAVAPNMGVVLFEPLVIATAILLAFTWLYMPLHLLCIFYDKLNQTAKIQSILEFKKTLLLFLLLEIISFFLIFFSGMLFYV